MVEVPAEECSPETCPPFWSIFRRAMKPSNLDVSHRAEISQWNLLVSSARALARATGSVILFTSSAVYGRVGRDMFQSAGECDDL